MHKITTLDNGLRVVTQNMPGLETAYMGIFNSVGNRDEKKEINGAAHFLEHMAFKGTKTKTALEISDTIENVGGNINAYTSKEITAYTASLLGDDLHYGIDILTDILQNSTFAQEELDRERGTILQEIGMYLDMPASMVDDYFFEKAYPDQPMGRSILGPKEIIEKISRDQIYDFMHEHYNPKKMVISAAGKVDHNKFVDNVISKLNNLPKGNVNNPERAKFTSGEYREDKKLEQIHLMLGFEGINYFDEDYYSLEIYDSLLGGGMSSRLFQEVREKRGLVYSIQSFSANYTDTGIFGVGFGTGETQIQELIPVLCDELNKSVDDVDEKEVNRGKAQLKVSQMRSRERASSRCVSAAYQLLHHNRIIEPSEIIEKIDNVSVDTVKKIAKKIISRPMTISSIGPLKKLEYLDKIQSRIN